nr:uncharacterized protein LOC129267033 [Lytechinus pictus]
MASVLPYIIEFVVILVMRTVNCRALSKCDVTVCNPPENNHCESPEELQRTCAGKNQTNETFCVHGPFISGSGDFVAGKAAILTCSIYNVCPSSSTTIEWSLWPDEDCKERNDINRINLTGLEPFQMYNLTLRTDRGVVASKLASTAPPVPEYHGVIMTFSQENSKLKISRMLPVNNTIPDDLCFSVVKTQDQRDNCSLSNCLELGNKLRYINTSLEDVSDFRLVSSGRGLCSSPPSRPFILNSTEGVLNMPQMFILLGVVAGSAIFLFLSVAVIIVLCLRLKQNRNRMQVQGHKGRTSKGPDEEDPTGQGFGSNYESLDGPRGGISLYTGLNFPAKVAGLEEGSSGSGNHPPVVGEEDRTGQGVDSNYESLDGTRSGISLYTGLNFPAKVAGSEEYGSGSGNHSTVVGEEDRTGQRWPL